MFEKKFDEMYKIDVSSLCEKRDGIKYLNWAMCKKLLHDNGAEKVYFEPLVNNHGSTLFASDLEFANKSGNINRCYEVRVKIVIDNLEFVQNYPLLNGTNPVCDNSMSQLRLANAQARAFVKGVAIHTGLGFQLWCENDETITHDVAVYPAQMDKLKELAQDTYTSLLTNKHMSTDDIVKALGVANFDVLKSMFAKFDECKKFIEDMQKL